MSQARRPALVWFRRDLRLADNPALTAAAATGRPLVALYALDGVTAGRWAPGAASRWWLHHSLDALARDLAGRGVRLVLRRGDPAIVVAHVAREVDAAALYWNRCYEPAAVARDRTLKADLRAGGLAVESFNGTLLAEPWALTTTGGGPFRMFTPFWRALRARVGAVAPLPTPQRLAAYGAAVATDRLDDWGLLPTAPDWAAGLRDAWQPGERGAWARLEAFLDGPLAGYGQDRDRPDHDRTGRISPHLHWGELSPRQVWHRACSRLPGDGLALAEPFLRQLGWREFSAGLLFHAPDLPEQPLRPEFARFPWRPDTAVLQAWQRGRTGYPLVDAGMRQLWATGWMHNRVRMVAASFLVKHLLQPWQDGAAWFWDTLVDADLANNAASWQWVAGCGTDAAPYFRIFNPVAQGERFDPDGAYVGRWVPELARLPAGLVHRPWTADPELLGEAGVRLGETYPLPIVDHAQARARALRAYAALRLGG
ncbi:MAG: cryptochrome/photolyase family protein [Alphaproteobacteria bacterium]